MARRISAMIDDGLDGARRSRRRHSGRRESPSPTTARICCRRSFTASRPIITLANREFLFPFAAVVECPQSEMFDASGPSLVVTALTNDENFRAQLLALAARRPLELRADPDEPDQLGPAARRQPVRSPVRAPRVSSGLMRILSLTAGAAGMYCGTCLRDNALARELIRRGTTCCSFPIYTPTLTDEENVSSEKVFFGGISVYLQQHYPMFRKLPAFLDKLWDSKWALKLATSGSIPVDPKLLGEMTVSMLSGRRGFQAKRNPEAHRLAGHRAAARRHRSAVHPVDRLREATQRRALNRPVICTLQGEDLFLEGLKEPWRSQCLRLIRSNLRYIDRFIAVSAYYAAFMSDYLGISHDRIEVSPLGISSEGHLRLSGLTRAAASRLLRAHRPGEGPAHPGRGRLADEGTRRASSRRISAAGARRAILQIFEREVRGLTRPRGKDRLPAVDRRILHAEPVCRPQRTLAARSDGERRARSCSRITGPFPKSSARPGRRSVRPRRTQILWPLPSIELARDRDRLRQLSAECRARRPRAVQHLGYGHAHRRDLPSRDARSRRLLKAENVSKRYETAAGHSRSTEKANLTLAARRGSRDHGAIRQRQEHDALSVRRARYAHQRDRITLQRHGCRGARMRSTRPAFRNEHIGFVFQDHALLPQCTVLENVLVPDSGRAAGTV